MAADWRLLRTGAAKFSASGLKRQDNDLIVIEGAGAARAFKRAFDVRIAGGEALLTRMRWRMWVVMIAGSTGSALRAVRPPNLHITPAVRRDLVHSTSATGSL